MNYLAIDTSSRALTVLAKKGDTLVCVHEDDCALRHSVVLMDRIDEALSKAELSVAECDFFSCVVGPGSFTGIRIGIATMKGFAFAAKKPTLPITSFEVMTYAVRDEAVLALVDAGRDHYYMCGYSEAHELTTDAEYAHYLAVEKLREQYDLVSGERLPFFTKIVDMPTGLARAVERKAQCKRFAPLEAVYLRKSQAEEQRARGEI
ncbi:MAG: tRNA (adenosine(37)-N6)-threonylcarbamoyltransferase complex dimerization subunit type 1 TsaB [Christensenellaceae bacterium]